MLTLKAIKPRIFSLFIAGALAVITATCLLDIAYGNDLSIRDFAMKPTGGMVELGPKGQSLALLSKQYGPICRSEQRERRSAKTCKADERELASTDRIIIIDVEKMAQHRIIPIPDDFTVNWMEWTSPDNLLISITSPWQFAGRSKSARTGTNIRGELYNYPTGRILSVNRNVDKEPVTLFGDDMRLLRENLRLSRVVDLLHDDPDHVVMGAWRNSDYDLFWVNVNDGSFKRVAKGKNDTYAWYTDKTGAPSIRLDCVGRSCPRLNAYRPEDGADPNDDKTDWVKFRTIMLRKRGHDEVMELDLIAPTGRPDEYYVEVDGEGEERRTIKTYDIRSDRFIGTVFSDPDYDVGGVLIDPETGDYAGAYLWRDRIEYHLEDKALARHLKAINAFFDNRWNVSMTGFSHDGEAAIVFASAPNDPGAYYLYTFADHRVSRLLGTYEHMPVELDARTDIVSLPMRDGTVITGYHTQPGKTASGQGTAPLIVMVHGGPERRDLFAYDRDVQFLASRGYQVLQVNFRGSSGYGRAFAEAGYRQWGGTIHEDVLDATRHMVADGKADGDKVCIMGHSYGGYAALLAEAKASQDFACIIAGSGPSDLVEILKQERRDHGSDSSAFEYWTKSIGDERDDRAALDRISPVHLASRYDDPVLLIHGANDKIVQVSHSQEMHSALQDANKSVRYLELEDEGHYHNNWSIETSEAYFTEIESFLSQVFPD